MTNQEAISILKTWRVTGDKEHEALDMAISALQAQPEPCNLPQLDTTYEDGDKLDEAIRDFERNAQNDDDNFHLTGAKCFNGCAEYEWRIVSWLRELKERREQDVPDTNVGDMISRQAAIDAVRKCSVKEVTPAFMLVDKAEVMTELMMLPPAQPELATDYTSKQSVIDAITDENIIRNMDSVMDSEMHRVKRSAHRIIASIPSAQPETGYWISARDEDGRHMWLICSECRAKETNLKAKYCPVCGRKMA